MKRMGGLFLLVLMSVLPAASAQGVYLGGGATLSSPSLSVQLGIGLPAGLELRAVVTAARDLSQITSAGADFLYTVALPSSRLYLGAGGDAFFNGDPPDSSKIARNSLGVHATGGAEFRLGALGFFGEVQPGLRLEPSGAYLRTRVGLNLHF